MCIQNKILAWDNENSFVGFLLFLGIDICPKMGQKKKRKITYWIFPVVLFVCLLEKTRTEADNFCGFYFNALTLPFKEA